MKITGLILFAAGLILMAAGTALGGDPPARPAPGLPPALLSGMPYFSR